MSFRNFSGISSGKSQPYWGVAYSDLFSRILFSFLPPLLCPLCWPPLFLPFSRRLFAPFLPSKNALFCRARGTAQSLGRGSFRTNPPTKFGKFLPEICVKTVSIDSDSNGFWPCDSNLAAFWPAILWFAAAWEALILRRRPPGLKKIYQRTMTICVASLFWGNLGHGHRLFLFRNKCSEDHDHMCQKVFLR